MRLANALSILAFFGSMFACSIEKDTDSTTLYGPNDNTVSVVFKNSCAETIRVGKMGSGDFATLGRGQTFELTVGSDSRAHESIAYYAYRHNEFPGFGNMTLAEFSFNPHNSKQDFYDVSLVDAYNVPMLIRAAGQNCAVAGCTASLIAGCAPQNRVVRNGKVIACSKFGDKDNPNNPAARYFENSCKQAYSWSKDDWATKGCFSQDYHVEICGR